MVIRRKSRRKSRRKFKMGNRRKRPPKILTEVGGEHVTNIDATYRKVMEKEALLKKKLKDLGSQLGLIYKYGPRCCRWICLGKKKERSIKRLDSDIIQVEKDLEKVKKLAEEIRRHMTRKWRMKKGGKRGKRTDKKRKRGSRKNFKMGNRRERPLSQTPHNIAQRRRYALLTPEQREERRKRWRVNYAKRQNDPGKRRAKNRSRERWKTKKLAGDRKRYEIYAETQRFLGKEVLSFLQWRRNTSSRKRKKRPSPTSSPRITNKSSNTALLQSYLKRARRLTKRSPPEGIELTGDPDVFPVSSIPDEWVMEFVNMELPPLEVDYPFRSGQKRKRKSHRRVYRRKPRNKKIKSKSRKRKSRLSDGERAERRIRYFFGRRKRRSRKKREPSN